MLTKPLAVPVFLAVHEAASGELMTVPPSPEAKKAFPDHVTE
jgi:hypothetical protein